MIHIQQLCKSFGKQIVLDNISLFFAPGKVTALIGPNGAGKSTLIKSILSLVKPDSGIILIGDKPSTDVTARRQIGYMPQVPQFPPHMTVREILEFVQNLRKDAPHRDMKMLNLLGLMYDLDKPFKTLSGGTKQKINTVIAFLFLPQIFIFDEPTSGLDPVSTLRFKQAVRDEAKLGKTIIYTSHILQEIEELADDIVYIDEGKIKIHTNLATFLSTHKTQSLEKALTQHLRNNEAA